ncbi:hypothetical protein BKA63DRAFT_574967 [Paraphoma chrysanthemicola]|nr:hypothetical protein BKA63DRAFT_574967 [Paraphoma chrysanthemicola]
MDAPIPSGIVKHRAARFEQDQSRTMAAPAMKYLANDNKKEDQGGLKRNGVCSTNRASLTQLHTPTAPLSKPSSHPHAHAPNPQDVTSNVVKSKSTRLATRNQRLTRKNEDLVETIGKYRAINADLVKQNAVLLKKKRMVLGEKLGLEEKVGELGVKLVRLEGEKRSLEVEKKEMEMGKGDENDDGKAKEMEAEKKRYAIEMEEKGMGKEMGKRKQEEGLEWDVFMRVVLVCVMLGCIAVARNV